jgi:hypothetical protein
MTSLKSIVARAKAARRPTHASRDQAEQARAEAQVAREQDAVLREGLHEDDAHRHADLDYVAEEEAESLPWTDRGGQSAR